MVQIKFETFYRKKWDFVYTFHPPLINYLFMLSRSYFGSQYVFKRPLLLWGDYNKIECTGCLPNTKNGCWKDVAIIGSSNVYDCLSGHRTEFLQTLEICLDQNGKFHQVSSNDEAISPWNGKHLYKMFTCFDSLTQIQYLLMQYY